jgi:hypothetical protein
VAVFQYGSPTAPTIERPRCWGRSFDEMSGECRRCGFQNSCKDEIIRLNINRQMPAPMMPAYGGPVPAGGYAAPQQLQQPVMMQMAPPQAQVAGAMMVRPPAAPPVAQEAAARQVQMMQQQQRSQEVYGWLHDPLYYTMAATPPPVRPQLQGESFWERVAKNAALSMGEAFFGQCFLAVRQLVLPPKPPEQHKTVDVPPVSGNPQTPGQ